jgi:phosphoribosyl-ATP pyrophosphohydrolase
VELADLEALLRDRLANPVEGSYSITLLRDPTTAARKIMEEAFELTLELVRDPVDRPRAAAEAADVLFHTLAGLVGAGVPLADVYAELEARRR